MPRKSQRRAPLALPPSQSGFIRNPLTMTVLNCAMLMLSTANAASIRNLGPGSGYPTDVSADGSVVVGQLGFRSVFNPVNTRAFRWTEATGVVDLGKIDPITGVDATASAVSADGSVAVGSSGSINGHLAFRWTEDAGMVPLGKLPGDSFSHAFGMSADGSEVFGVSGRSSVGTLFRWTQTEGMQPLAPGSIGGSIAAVSADASTVVWESNGATWRWTQTEGVVNLNNPISDSAYAASLDGSVIVGGGGEAWRWTEATGFVPLGVSGGVDGLTAAAMAVSADGSVVVGRGMFRSLLNTQNRAFYWSEARGLRWLHQMLADDYGLDLTGYLLSEATAISADGRTIVGYDAFRGSSWIVTIPEPSAFVLAVAGLGLCLARRRRP